MAIGKIGALNAAERQRSEPRQLSPRPMARAWEYWTMRLQKAGGLPPQTMPSKAKPAKAKAKPRSARPTKRTGGRR